MEQALEAMKKQGATLVDPADIETLGKFDESELLVFMYELKADLNAYLARLGPNAPVKSLKDIIEFNDRNRQKEMPYFGQDLFLKSEAKGPLTEKEYLDALAKNRQLARVEGIDATMDKFHLDAIVAPTGGPAWLTDLVAGRYTGLLAPLQYLLAPLRLLDADDLDYFVTYRGEYDGVWDYGPDVFSVVAARANAARRLRAFKPLPRGTIPGTLRNSPRAAQAEGGGPPR